MRSKATRGRDTSGLSRSKSMDIATLERHYYNASAEVLQFRIEEALQSSSPQQNMSIYGYATYPGLCV